jgi:16S rRNA (guanine966-N2)-methyltransferase
VVNKAKSTRRGRAPLKSSEKSDDGRNARRKDRTDVAKSGARDASSRSRILRIVGGRHRGRRLQFPAGIDIRPTPDRVRETLFNWLQPRIAAARVLDLFAGSGALGLEALSRGAAHVTFVEKDRRAAAAIGALANDWGEQGAQVICADAIEWLSRPAVEPYDVVFLDPPYDAGLLESAARSLTTFGRLAPDARIYVERRARDALPTMPDGWQSLRDGRAGEVGYHLFAS